jgi:hypothetical protein
MSDEAEVARIAEAVETEAQRLADDGNIAASNALYELVYKANGDTLIRFSRIISGLYQPGAGA